MNLQKESYTTQYAAFEKLFHGALKEGTLSSIDKSDPDSAGWKPIYVENYSIAYGVDEAYALSTALWRHYVSANMNYLFNLVNRNLSERRTWLRFPNWKEYGDKELGILFETYLEDELYGGAGGRLIGPTKGVHVYSKAIWTSTGKPISFRVSNDDNRRIYFTVGADFIKDRKAVGKFPNIFARTGAKRNYLSLPAHNNEQFTWIIDNFDKSWARAGKWSVQLRLSYGYNPDNAFGKTSISQPFTVGYPDTVEDIFDLPEHGEALLEMYYRLKERQIGQGYQSLSSEEALLVDLWDLQGYFGHSAWEGKQYLIHHGDRAVGIESAFQKIGSLCLAAHFGNIIDQFPGRKIPSKPQERKKIIETWQDAEDARLTELAESFWAKYDHNQNAVCKEDLNELLYKYIFNQRSKIH